MGEETFFKSSKKIVVTPISALQHGTPITFVYENNGINWMDLFNSYLYLKVRILKAAGADIIAGDVVGPVNNLLHSLFSNVDIELNGKPMSDQNALYPYRGFLDTILYEGWDSLDSKGGMALWIADTAGKQMEFASAAGSPNDGLATRRSLFPAGKSVELKGKLCTDLFQMNAPVMPGLPLKIKLIPTHDNFVLMTPAPTTDHPQVPFTLQIEEARFILKTLEPTPSFALETERRLLHEPFKYFMTRKTMKHVAIASGQTSSSFDNILMGERPDRIFVVMVSDAAMAGGYQQNPFNFQHAKLNYLAITFDGVPVMDSPYTPDFVSGQFLPLYNGMFESLGMLNLANRGVGIKRSDYPQGYTILGFDLTTDNNPLTREPAQAGTVRLELKFAEALTAQINVIILAEYKVLFEVDKHRNVITPFG